MTTKKSKKNTLIVLYGALFLLIGLVFNTRILAFLFSRDATIDTMSFRIAIYTFQTIFILLGLLFICKRKSIDPARLTLLFGSVLLTIIILECSLRISNSSIPSEHDWFFQYNPLLGWEFIPNKSGNVPIIGQKARIVTINNDGMRDKEYSIEKPHGKKRIAVLGDSFTSNIDVYADDVYTEVMEKLLPDNWQVLNFGVNGFGPIQEFFMLESKAIKYKPDIVIMTIYIRNDFDDIIGIRDWLYERPRVKFDKDGEIVFYNIPVPLSGSKRKKENLLTKFKFHLLDFVYARLSYKADISKTPQEIRLFKKQHSDEMAKAYMLMRALIKKAYYFSKENGAEFLVVIAPTMVQVYDNIYWDDIKRKYHLESKEYDILLPNKFIKKVCKKSGIHFVDLTSVLRHHVPNVEELYYRNQHWNKRGNQLVAQAIIEYLINNRLVNEFAE